LGISKWVLVFVSPIFTRVMAASQFANVTMVVKARQ